MRIISRVVAAVGVTTALAVAPLSAAVAAPSGPTAVFQGTFSGETQHTNCTVHPDGWSPTHEFAVEGNWRIFLRGGDHTPVVNVLLFYDGKHHLSYGGGGWSLDTTDPSQLVLTAGTPWNLTNGLQLTYDYASGDLTYFVAPYGTSTSNTAYEFWCDSLTLTGTGSQVG